MVVLLMVTGLLLVLATAPAQVAGQAPLLSGEEQALLDYINSYRIENSLTPLNVSPTLTASAHWMSQDLGDNDYFSHTDSLGRSPFQRMAIFGYDCEAYNTWCGENLAAGSSSGSQTFDLWRNSPGHNANMLNPNYRVAGIAAVLNQDSTYGWYWTLDMGGFDDGGQPPPTETPPLPPTETPPLPTETPLPPTETPPAETVSLQPTETGRQFGLAPPTRADEIPTTDTTQVRELEVGWNRLNVTGQARRVAEVLPVNDGRLLAMYAWDQGSRAWRRYLPGVGIPGVNTLTEMRAGQTVWILAGRPVMLTLPT
jgi:uncharacterized protein YkwD